MRRPNSRLLHSPASLFSGRKGEKFSDLAHQNSDEVESANNGGYAGAYKRGLLMKPIEDIVFKENKGYITDPIKIPSGYVIFKVEERYGAGQASFEEVKDDVQARLSEPKMTPKVREFLTRLRQEAFLEIKEGYIDSGAAPGKDTRWHEVAQLKPATTTKEEVAAHATERRKFLFVPIPGTHKKVKPKIDTKPAATPAPAETPVKQ